MERESRARRGCGASLPLKRIATSKAPVLKNVGGEDQGWKSDRTSYLDYIETTSIELYRRFCLLGTGVFGVFLWFFQGNFGGFLGILDNICGDEKRQKERKREENKIRG